MKTLLLVLIAMFFIPSCSSDDFDLDKPDVRKFVAKVKSGTYDYREVGETGDPLWLKMPAFTEKDIPVLLELASDTTHIEEFPENPISSIRLSRHILGECLLWVVEGIRMERSYGSLAPSLYIHDESLDYRRYLTGEEILEVCQAYLNWWEKVKEDKYLMKRVNPLMDTPYHW